MGDLREVPVIAVSAHALAGDCDRSLAAGFDGYVSKPITDPLGLQRTIELLARRPKSQER